MNYVFKVIFVFSKLTLALLGPGSGHIIKKIEFNIIFITYNEKEKLTKDYENTIRVY